MFYLQVKDGETFLTSVDSDDKEEFGDIIEGRLGRDARTIYSEFIKESEETAYHYIQTFDRRFKDCIDQMDKTLGSSPYDTNKLENILSEMQSLYLDFMR